MLLLLSLTLLFHQAGDCAGITDSGLTFKIISHTLTDEGDYLPGVDRRAVFRLTNGTKKRLIVYGSKVEGGFLPNGYVVQLNEGTGSWTYPNPDNRPTPWAQISDKDGYVLRPGKSIDIEAGFGQVEVGRKFKRTVLVSFDEGAEPCEVLSEELTLR